MRYHFALASGRNGTCACRKMFQSVISSCVLGLELPRLMVAASPASQVHEKSRWPQQSTQSSIVAMAFGA